MKIWLKTKECLFLSSIYLHAVEYSVQEDMKKATLKITVPKITVVSPTYASVSDWVERKSISKSNTSFVRVCVFFSC